MAKPKKKLVESVPEVGAAVPRGTVSEAFRTWLVEKKTELPEDALALVDDAISEMFDLRGQLFDDWWIRNHYRYQKMREIERSRARFWARSFFAAVQARKVKL